MKKLPAAELKAFLDEKADHYNTTAFIESDPVSIPHMYNFREDIEISGFLTATISWGRRPSILKNAKQLMDLMDDSPSAFIRNFKESDLDVFGRFVHRTFNGEDCKAFLRSLQHMYCYHGGLESLFTSGLSKNAGDLKTSLVHSRQLFFSIPHPARTRKHFSDPASGSAAKRLNMFLRWMVRTDHKGVDFGIWNKISPSVLTCPLDVHSARVARKLGLLKRTSNDWSAAAELTKNLCRLDPSDPVKYDFALFGLGVFEKF